LKAGFLILQTELIAEIVPVKFNGPWGGVQQFRYLFGGFLLFYECTISFPQ